MTEVQTNSQGKVYIVNGKVLLSNTFTGVKKEVSQSGVYGAPSTSFTFSTPSNSTKINSYGLAYAFYISSGLTSMDLSTIQTIADSGLRYCCVSCTNLTSVNFSSLKTIYGYGLNTSFSGCSSLINISFPELESIEGNGMRYCFTSCSSITSMTFPKLLYISGNGMNGCFNACSSLTILSFPSLTSNSFGGYQTCFDSMLLNVTGCTVHFPSNLQSVIGSWSSVTNGFGGTNTTILFDLTATS